MFEYVVKYYDDEDYKIKVAKGLIGSPSYTETMRMIWDYFDNVEEAIISISITELDNPLSLIDIKEWCDNNVVC